MNDERPRCTSCGGSSRRRTHTGTITCPWCRGTGHEPTAAELAARSVITKEAHA